MEIVKSAKGNNMVALNGFLFCKDKQNKNGTFAYKCTDNSCPSRGVLSEDLGNFQLSKPHDHLPDEGKILVLKRRAALKEKVLSQPTKPLKRLYVETFGDIEDSDNFVSEIKIRYDMNVFQTNHMQIHNRIK